MRTLAIGDIHGYLSSLEHLINSLNVQPDDRVIFLGDYVDRGPASAGVLDFLLQFKMQYPNTICLRGNHEILMADAFMGMNEYKMWYSVGGAQTLESYRTPEIKLPHITHIPEEHYHFITQQLIDVYETETEIFVHANLEADVPLEAQAEIFLFWEFLRGPVTHISGKRMICGHTNQKSGKPLAFPSTVCIDTSVYTTGWLTCLHVEENKYYQANVTGQLRSDYLDIVTN